MVEFGLKLEDNKVSEWSSAYINYEKLKTLLSKIKEAEKKKEELEKQNPSEAADVWKRFSEEFEQRKKTGDVAVMLSRSFSATSLDQQDMQSSKSLEGKTANEGEGGADGAETGPGPVVSFAGGTAAPPSGSETSSLLIKPSDGKSGPIFVDGEEVRSNLANLYGSQVLRKSGGSQASMASASGTGSGNNLVDLVKGYFRRSTYTDKLWTAYKDCASLKLKFEDLLDKEMEKVSKFYDDKVDELTQRFDVLVESVGLPDPSKAPRSPLATNDSINSVGLRQRKSQGFIGRIRQSILVMGGQSRRHLHDVVPVMHTFASHSDDEEEAGDKAFSAGQRGRRTISPGESDSIMRDMSDLYRRAKLLQNFTIMNYTGFVKVVKKHDKNVPADKGKFKENLLDGCSTFKDGIEADRFCRRIEKVFASWFCGGSIAEAQAQLLTKRGDVFDMDWTQLRLGFRLGMCAILGLWVCWDCIWGMVNKGDSTIGGRTAFPVFRACGGLLLWHWFWGFSVFIWSRYRVNYIFLFDFDPRIVDTPVKIFSDVVDETLVFLILMLLYYKAGVNAIPDIIPPGGYPLILVLYTIKELVLPWRIRGRLWKAIGEVVTSPLHSPTFFTIYVADVFTSLVKVFQDILWTVCFVFSGDFALAETSKEERQPRDWQHQFWYKNVAIPMICLFPLWIRFNQCLRRYMDTGKRCPNLANASKYALSQTVTLFGAFHPLYLYLEHNDVNAGHNLFQFFWMFLFVASSLYSFFWDVYMDWGLGRPAFGFLGPRLMYPSRWYYYGVMCADFILRFFWVLTLVPPQSGASFELPNYMTAVSMSVELLRRMLWGSFRLEQEHRHNTEGYRRVDFVPLHFHTEHDHKYKKLSKHRGRAVMVEVAGVILLVVGISVASVIAAQKSAGA